MARALTLAAGRRTDAGRWLDLCAGPGGKTALLAALGRRRGPGRRRSNRAARRADLVEQNTRGLPVEVLRVDGRDTGLDAGLRPGARRRAVHRAGRAAAPARGAVAASAGRRAAAGQAATRTAGVGDRADPARRCRALRDLLAAPGRDRRRGRRRAAPPPGDRAGHPAAVRPGRRRSATGRTCSCGRTGTAPTRCSPPRCEVTGAHRLTPWQRPADRAVDPGRRLRPARRRGRRRERRRLAARRRDGQPLRAEPDPRPAGRREPARRSPTSRWTAT